MKLYVLISLLIATLPIRYFFFYHNQIHYADGQYVEFQTTLFSEPKIFGNYQTLSANLEKNKISIRTNLYPQYHYQDTVRISGKIKIKTLGNRRTITTMYFPKIEAIKNEKNMFLSLTNSIRQKVILLFSKTLPIPSSSLMLGIVFGIKESMPKDFADNLRISGVLHVVAASGMNISMAGSFLSSIFIFFFRRQIALFLSILGIIFYAFLSGLEPSIVRASIMGSLVFSSQILGRQSLASYGLFLAAFLMLIASPDLLFDVGFQLSFLATFGLLHIRPIFDTNKKVKRIIKKSIIGENIVVTVVAQLATLPILLANFGTYSVWSVVVNSLVLWTVPALMVVGGIASIVGVVFEPFGKLILYLSFPFLIYFQKIVEIFASFKGVISFNQFPWQFVVGYYILLLTSVASFKRNIKI